MSKSNIVPFNFEDHPLRVILDKEGYRWFVLSELLDSAGSSTKVAAAVESVKNTIGNEVVSNTPIRDKANRLQNTTIVREEGATFLIAGFRTELGKRFNRFIHMEVLPSIRSDGGYIAPSATPEQAKRLAVRLKGIETRHLFTDVLKDHGVTGGGYAMCTDAINTPILGAPAALVKITKGLPAKAPLRDNLTTEQLTMLDLAEMVSKRKITEQNIRGNHPCANICGKTAKAIVEAVN